MKNLLSFSLTLGLWFSSLTVAGQLTASAGSITATNAGGNMTFLTTAATGGTTTTRMTLLNGGSLGIGTASPADVLHVIGSTRANQFNATSGIYNVTGSTMSFQVAASTKMTLTSGGALGIATTTPSDPLHVNGNARANQFNAVNGILNSIGATTSLKFSINGSATPQMTLDAASGALAIGTTTPASGELLHVNGNARANQFNAVNGILNSIGATTSLKFSINGNAVPAMTLDAASGALAIGTTTPASGELLHVNGNARANQFNAVNGIFNSVGASNLTLSANGTARMTVLNGNGFVGLNTAAPEALLHIKNGNLILENSATPIIYTGTGTTELNRYLQLVNSPGLTNASGLKAGGLLVADAYGYANPSKNDLIVKGNVGIGTPLTTNPNGYTLAVNGKIGAKDVQVETSSTTWPDYVFNKDYVLPSLQDVEKYIEKNKHLENVPSAAEIEKNGLNLAKMDEVLLKKVEELTLYVIQLQKEVEALKQQAEKNKK